ARLRASEYFNVVPGEVVRVASGGGGRFTLRDAIRHVPVRTEDNGLHVAAEDRRFVTRLADDDAQGRDGPAGPARHHEKRGNVAEKVPRPEIVRHPAPALEFDLHLPNAVPYGDIHGSYRRSVDDAGGWNRMALLKRLDRRFEIRVERGGRRSAGVCQLTP